MAWVVAWILDEMAALLGTRKMVDEIPVKDHTAGALMADGITPTDLASMDLQRYR